MSNEIIDQIENILYGVNMGDPQPGVEPGDSTGRVAARAVTRWLAVHDAEVAAKTLEDAVGHLLATGGPQDRDCARWLRARAAGIRGTS